MFKKMMTVAFLACLVTLMSAAQTLAARPHAGDVITNTVTADYEDASGTAMPQESATVDVTILQVYSVTVTPATDAKTGSSNGYVTYTVTVTNTGNGTDTFDLTNVHIAGSSAWTPFSVVFYSDAGLTSVITATNALAADSGSQTVYAKLTIPTPVTDGTVSVDQLTATSQGDATATDYDEVTTTVGVADLSTSTKEADNTNYQAGETVTYTITLHNTGTVNATNVLVTDVLPSYLTYVSGGSYDVPTRTVTFPYGTLAAGASDILVITCTVNGGTPDTTVISNTATITYRSGNNPTNEPDETPSVDVTVDAPALAVTKDANPTSAKPGDVVTYTITVINNGHAVASNVVISDVVPTTYLAFGAIGTQTNCSASEAGGTVTATPTGGTLDPAESMSFEFTVTVRTN